jgi:Ca2+-binding RTX toxin-like protein
MPFLAPLTRTVVHGTTGDDTFNFSPSLSGASNQYPLGVEYFSNGGNDHVTGSFHNDVFVLNSGVETINGNGGSDTVDYSNSYGGVAVNLREVTQHGGWAEGDQLTNISNVTGSSYDDNLNAKITGSIINGMGGDDFIDTSLGNDTVNGGAGKDFITSGAGTDVLTGGGDKDTFDIGVSNYNFNVTITDFNPLISVNQHATESQLIADPVHDVLQFAFFPESGVTRDANADAAFKMSLGADGQMHPFAISGHDVVLTIHTADVDGTVTLKGLADLLPDDHHFFTVIDHAVSGGAN